MPDSYERGDTAELKIEIRNTAGVLVDPAAVTLMIRTPAGVTTTEAMSDPDIVVHDSTGVFHRDLPLVESGVWAYQWQTTNPGQVQGGQINVRQAPLDIVPRSLSLTELKRRLDTELTADDDLLADYLDAAFEQAQAPWPNGCGRLLTPDPVSDDDPPVQRRIVTRRRRVRVPDARSITQVLVDDVAITGYETMSRDGMIVQLDLDDDGGWLDELAPARRRRRVVTVTGRFGFQELPVSLADAIYILAARDYYERAAQFADQVEILEGAAVQNYYRQLPPRTKLVFSTFALAPAHGGLP